MNVWYPHWGLKFITLAILWGTAIYTGDASYTAASFVIINIPHRD